MDCWDEVRVVWFDVFEVGIYGEEVLKGFKEVVVVDVDVEVVGVGEGFDDVSRVYIFDEGFEKKLFRFDVVSFVIICFVEVNIGREWFILKRICLLYLYRRCCFWVICF